MANHIVAPNTGGNFPAKLTKQVVLCSLIAAFGGLMFGYDIGISGGVTSMDDFLLEFFPSVYEKNSEGGNTITCSNCSRRRFTWRRSSAAGCGILLQEVWGKRTMQMAAAFFFVGVVLNAASVNIYMLIAGRICLGAGIGFGNQAVPLFISEIAPAKYRGGLMFAFRCWSQMGF
ncbi:UNVERIFIED_CONTAM: Sugar transport protein 8 [Sesamum latifolium]|uniref:Sugar transport protein 8 n=1 Tax=Sesamum latifolium TaxID=2727402 RepID=A0AAW2XZT0_9LAMI